MNIRAQALAMASVAAVAVSSPQAQARDIAPETPVGVAIVDVDIEKIDFDDPNVRIVQVNPKRQQEFVNREATLDGSRYSHGDIVASSFVREYRKIEPTQPIVIYAVNPMVEKGGSMQLSMRAIREAMPVLKANNVRVAVTAFGTDTPEGGETFLKPFVENNMIVFAATPNERTDRAIYPAASPNAISVATERKDDWFAGNKGRASKWVDFTNPGDHGSHDRKANVSGSSFAVAHVAAVGAYILKNKPTLTIGELRQEMGSAGTSVMGKTVRLSGRQMIDKLKGLGNDDIQTALLLQSQRSAANGR